MIEFKLPSLGADMDEGTLLEWKIQPGDKVKPGQVIAVVDTAKETQNGNNGHGSKIIVVPFDGAALDRDLAEL